MDARQKPDWATYQLRRGMGNGGRYQSRKMTACAIARPQDQQDRQLQIDFNFVTLSPHQGCTVYYPQTFYSLSLYSSFPFFDPQNQLTRASSFFFNPSYAFGLVSRHTRTRHGLDSLISFRQGGDDLA
jgi:hypothetical protein